MIVKKSPINQGFWNFDIVNFFTKHSDKEYVFLDIETTGFSPKNSQLYLIGSVLFSENSWIQTQCLAETFDEEFLILERFLRSLPKNFCLITFNGSTFDIPYLRQKINQFSLNMPHIDFNYFDLYKVLQPYKQLLNFSHFRQQDLENFIDFHRNKDVSAKKCITIYQQFLRTEESPLLDILLHHNELDLSGMQNILSLLAYTQLTLGLFQIHTCTVNQDELHLDCSLRDSLPKPVEFGDELFRFRGSGKDLSAVLPLHDHKLRKFYANYKDYVYLPGEDMAIHKSLSSCLPRDKKKRATAKTCYTWFDCNSTFTEHSEQLKACLTEYFQLSLLGHLIPQ